MNLDKEVNLSKDDIKNSYNYIISYVNTPSKIDFIIPNFPSSMEGKLHFKEVQNLILKINYGLLVSFFLTLIALYVFYKIKNFSPLNTVSNLLFLISSALIILPFFNFNKSFTIFHNIVFNNNYWVFDPLKDPIIKILPEEFFMHCFIIFIMLLLIVSSLIKLIFYKILK